MRCSRENFWLPQARAGPAPRFWRRLLALPGLSLVGSVHFGFHFGCFSRLLVCFVLFSLRRSGLGRFGLLPEWQGRQGRATSLFLHFFFSSNDSGFGFGSPRDSDYSIISPAVRAARSRSLSHATAFSARLFFFLLLCFRNFGLVLDFMLEKHWKEIAPCDLCTSFELLRPTPCLNFLLRLVFFFSNAWV